MRSVFLTGLVLFALNAASVKAQVSNLISLEDLKLEQWQSYALNSVLETPEVRVKLKELTTEYQCQQLMALDFVAQPSWRGRYQESVLTLACRKSEEIFAMGVMDIRLFTDPSLRPSAQFRPMVN
jgi:hypothetical protein